MSSAQFRVELQRFDSFPFWESTEPLGSPGEFPYLQLSHSWGKVVHWSRCTCLAGSRIHPRRNSCRLLEAQRDTGISTLELAHRPGSGSGFIPRERNLPGRGWGTSVGRAGVGRTLNPIPSMGRDTFILQKCRTSAHSWIRQPWRAQTARKTPSPGEIYLNHPPVAPQRCKFPLGDTSPSAGWTQGHFRRGLKAELNNWDQSEPPQFNRD